MLNGLNSIFKGYTRALDYLMVFAWDQLSQIRGGEGHDVLQFTIVHGQGCSQCIAASRVEPYLVPDVIYLM